MDACGALECADTETTVQQFDRSVLTTNDAVRSVQGCPTSVFLLNHMVAARDLLICPTPARLGSHRPASLNVSLVAGRCLLPLRSFSRSLPSSHALSRRAPATATPMASCGSMSSSPRSATLCSAEAPARPRFERRRRGYDRRSDRRGRLGAARVSADSRRLQSRWSRTVPPCC